MAGITSDLAKKFPETPSLWTISAGTTLLVHTVYRSKMAMELQQASPMSKIDVTRLPSTLWSFGPVYLLHVSKNDD